METHNIIINGIVQGVGFRPFIYKLAKRYNLKGFIKNDSEGVKILLQGNEDDIKRFIEEIKINHPPRARIISIVEKIIDYEEFKDFKISESEKKKDISTYISPDIATCKECLEELFDEKDRRYLYPFINCTNCGPRFTITSAIPYDRINTTMAKFKMCEECEEEYNNPESRRFHAQPNACYKCGPVIRIIDRNLNIVEGDWLKNTINSLKTGKIIMIKGIGGYHIACNAYDKEAVIEVRKRKKRGNKPFALMGSLKTIKKNCYVSIEEENFLKSPIAPIVILKKRNESKIPDEVAPGIDELGFMLPYTPVHHLIIRNIDFPIVLTSANISEETILYEDENIKRLNGIFDLVLTHNRNIYIWNEDSVLRIFNNDIYPIRISRGFVPEPFKIPISSKETILGVGSDLKNTFCILKDNYAFTSQFIGDMGNIETERSFYKALEHFKKIYNLKIEKAVCDLHPGYITTSITSKLGIPFIKVQHHKAHFVACLIENEKIEKAIGFIFDGTGFGEDENIWGGEVFYGDIYNIERIYHLKYIPLPGSEEAIVHNWRYGISLLLDAGLEHEIEYLYKDYNYDILIKMIKKNINSPLTSSMGRLFDGISSILNICHKNTYEGEAAIRLEKIAKRDDKFYKFIIKDNLIYFDDVIRNITKDLKMGIDKGLISYRFHKGISNLIKEIIEIERGKRDFKFVVLSGGVFQNILLLELAYENIKELGLNPLVHRRLPTNDQCISLGQVSLGSINFNL